MKIRDCILLLTALICLYGVLHRGPKEQLIAGKVLANVKAIGGISFCEGMIEAHGVGGKVPRSFIECRAVRDAENDGRLQDFVVESIPMILDLFQVFFVQGNAISQGPRRCTGKNREPHGIFIDSIGRLLAETVPVRSERVDGMPDYRYVYCSRGDLGRNGRRVSGVTKLKTEGDLLLVVRLIEGKAEGSHLDELNPWSLRYFELPGRSVSGYLSGVGSFLGSLPLFSGEHGIKNTRQANRHRRDCCDRIRMSRVRNPSKDHAPNVKWCWFLGGIVGIIMVVHGFATALLGYLSFGKGWSSRVLTKGVLIFVSGWLLGFIGFWKWIN